MRLPNRSGITYTTDVGARIVDVFTSITLKKGREITLESVELVGEFDGVHVIDTIMVADGGLNADLLLGYPNPGLDDGMKWDRRTWESHINRRPVEGALLRHGDAGIGGYRLVVPIEVVEPGRWHRKHVRVHYVEDGQAFHQDLPIEVVLCTPEGLDDEGECPSPSLFD